MKPKINNETKTGIVVLLCLAALTFLLFKVGKFTPFEKGYVIVSRFDFIGGVKRHAPVRLLGVDVGEVKDIRIIDGQKTMVELDLWVKQAVKIRRDATAVVTTLGLMGEMYIEIKEGTPGSEYAKPGDILVGEGPMRLDDLVKIGTDVAKSIGQMAKDISKVSEHFDRTIEDNRSKIDRIFDNLEETTQNFKEFSEDIKYNPWKIFFKGKEKTREEIAKEKTREETTKEKTVNITPKNKRS